MTVNGKQTPLPAGGITLKGFLEASGYNPACVAIERNGAIVDKGALSFVTEPLGGDDVLEIVSFMGGG